MDQKSMEYCMFCGTKLQERELDGEGIIPYCEKCGEYRFQYGRNRYILVAGYVNKGEDAEDAVCREIQEEMGLKVIDYSFNHSHYFKPSNTLMLNFTAVVEDAEPHPNKEIDHYQWFSRIEARKNIYSGSLAEKFLLGYLDGEYHFE